MYHQGTTPELYEKTWLQDMFQKPIEFAPVSGSLPPNAWCLVQRPHLDQWRTLFAGITTPFQVLHLSDEFGTDPIDFYTHPMCKRVIRNYLRECPGNTTIIPLGYHHKAAAITPSPERKLMWSFHGTNWFNRQTQLEQFISYTPHHCKLQPQWNDPTATKKQEYLSDLSKSKFCPILRGNNVETFRVYEALEAGTLPIVVETNSFTEWVDSQLHLSDLYEWTNPKTMEKPVTAQLQMEEVSRWNQWKERTKRALT